MKRDVYEVTQTIPEAHPIHLNYPLLPGDLVTRDDDGNWTKHAPGLAVVGFVLTAEQAATLTPTHKRWTLA